MVMTAGDAAPHPEIAPGEALDATASESGAGQPVAGRRGRAGRAALVLLVLLIAALGAVLSSPFWAPRVAPLLPWGRASGASEEQLAALDARIAAVEHRPAAPTNDLAPLRAAEEALSQRVANLAGAVQAVGGDRQGLAETRTAVEALQRRIDGFAAQIADISAAEQKLGQQISRLDAAGAKISGRVTVLERQARAADSMKGENAALLLAFLPLREAVESGRPFAAAYDAFRGLAHDRPELIAAAEPLAAAASGGVPSRTALQAELAQLADRLAESGPPPADQGWGAQALARLRGLVSIRRIDGPSEDPSQAAVAAAERALAAGDADAAAKALGSLPAAEAPAAARLMQELRERAAATAALANLQQMLTARLAGPGPAKPPSGPAKPGAPS